MSAQQTFEEFCQQLVQKGVEEGAQIATLAMVRLGRILTDDEVPKLAARLNELGFEQTAERLRELGRA